jgi:hypothetical protein
VVPVAANIVSESTASTAAPISPAPLSGRRVCRRLLAFGLTLLAVDLAVRARAPDAAAAFDDDYRLPDDAEVVLLPHLLDHLRAVRQRGTPVVAVIGSSPTWGSRIRDPHHTVPAVLERELRRQYGRPVEVFNLSAKGFLIGDQAFIARAVGRDVDALVLQLNYHTFAPAIADAVRLRHPELPALLDQPVDQDDSRRLRLPPTPPGNWNGPLRQWLRRHWAFFRERDRLTVAWLGATPAAWLHKAWSQSTSTAADDDAGAPFDELAPARQMMIMKRYGRTVDFDVTPANTEWRTLQRLHRDLTAAGTPTFSYLSPINREALDDFEAMDWGRYWRNTATIATALGGGNLRDYNAGAVTVPGSEFYDISHTLDAGGERFGRRLAADMAAWLGPDGLQSGRAP